MDRFVVIDPKPQRKREVNDMESALGPAMTSLPAEKVLIELAKDGENQARPIQTTRMPVSRFI